MSVKPLLRLARATTVAALTVAASGPPVFGAVNEVALHLASVRCCISGTNPDGRLSNGHPIGKPDYALWRGRWTSLWVLDRDEG